MGLNVSRISFFTFELTELTSQLLVGALKPSLLLFNKLMGNLFFSKSMYRPFGLFPRWFISFGNEKQNSHNILFLSKHTFRWGGGLYMSGLLVLHDPLD